MDHPSLESKQQIERRISIRSELTIVFAPPKKGNRKLVADAVMETIEMPFFLNCYQSSYGTYFIAIVCCRGSRT